MKIAIGSDHRGDALAAALAEHLRLAGHDVSVLGVGNGETSDYPDRAYVVGQAVGSGRAERGILVCGSGIGMAIAANKMPGVRAAVVEGRYDAEMSRRHNDANVLCLSADRTEATEITGITDLWIGTEFEGGRHQRRVSKIAAIERGEDPRSVMAEAARD